MKLATEAINAIQRLAPKQYQVEFGITFSADAGAIVASASAEANFRVTLTWGQHLRKVQLGHKAAWHPAHYRRILAIQLKRDQNEPVELQREARELIVILMRQSSIIQHAHGWSEVMYFYLLADGNIDEFWTLASIDFDCLERA